METWEPSSLRDFAQYEGWSQEIGRDGSGRLTVQKVISGTVWAVAVIRPFDFEAGAQAAFTAEQEDAALAGYSVTQETYYTYPAYVASLADAPSGTVETHFHWLADTWIMGIEVRGATGDWPDVHTLGRDLLRFAVQDGLTAPPGFEQPTVTATPTSPPPPAPETPTTTSTPCVVSFSDVARTHWAYSYISRLACSGAVSGYADGSFRPDNQTTRGQLAKMIVLSQNWSLISPAAPSFRDASRSHIFYSYIETARAHGIISGYDDGTFRPDEFVKRAQVAKMVVRAEGWRLDPSNPTKLCDVAADHWSFLYVQTAIKRGIFSGYSDGCFRPDAYATRAQLAKVLVTAGQ